MAQLPETTETKMTVRTYIWMGCQRRNFRDSRGVFLSAELLVSGEGIQYTVLMVINGDIP